MTAGKQRIATAATEYRDRAAERRKAFNQPEKPGWIQLHPDKKRKYADAPPTPAVPEPGVEPGQDETNVGNQLLAKMGWKSGTGLGQEGAGRVEPIKVQQFAERAGLGASQGHSAGSWTGAGGRAQQAHDVVSLLVATSLICSLKRDIRLRTIVDSMHTVRLDHISLPPHPSTDIDSACRSMRYELSSELD